MSETPAEALRRGAEKMRALVGPAIHDIHENTYWGASRPQRAKNLDSAYAAGVRGGLGGPAGDLAAAFTPTAAALLAEQWDVTADLMDIEGATTNGNGNVHDATGRERHDWTATLDLIRRILGEEAA